MRYGDCSLGLVLLLGGSRHGSDGHCLLVGVGVEPSLAAVLKPRALALDFPASAAALAAATPALTAAATLLLLTNDLKVVFVVLLHNFCCSLFLVVKAALAFSRWLFTSRFLGLLLAILPSGWLGLVDHDLFIENLLQL